MLVLAFRVLLLLLAVGALIGAVVVGPARGRAGGESDVHYLCPMHPEVTSASPGECPICRMELERVGVGGPGARAASVNASTFQAYDYVRQRGFGQDLRAPAWIESAGVVTAILYRDELVGLAPEEVDVFSTSAPPTVNIEVHPAAELPVPWDRSTSRVRFRIDPSAASSPQGGVGWIKLSPRRRESQVIPSSAVLEANGGPYVLVASADGRRLTKRPVEIGRVLGGLAVVLSGLRLQERILTRSAFFVDAERRYRQEESIELAP